MRRNEMVSKFVKKFVVLTGVAIMASGTLMAAVKDVKKGSPVGGDVFYIFTERGSRLNHYIPSGWMGDYGDLKFNQGWKEKV